MSKELSRFGLPTKIAHNSEQFIFILRTMEDMTKKEAILECYVKGFHAVFIMTTAVAVTALLASFFIRRFSMDKSLVTQFTAK